MKKFIIFSLLLMLMVTLSNCAKKDIEVTQPTAEEAEKIQAIGDSLSMKLLSSLKKELTTAISEKGLVEAIRFCNLQALPVTAEIAKTYGKQVDIKRTSLKYRNPKNAPDRVETLALQYLEKLIKEGQALPPRYMQKVQEAGKTYYAYYKPLKVGGLCLACHGNRGQMDTQLRAALQELYPDDKAIGYKEGDFRGVVRVYIREP
ncbi:MAG: DUF3365 domain-containing protein, partial [Calditrichia bacterium]